MIKSRVHKELCADNNEIERIVGSLAGEYGAVFSSGYEYPGRHSRWDIGFVRPALKITSKEQTVTIEAFTERGRVLLPILSSALAQDKRATKGSAGKEKSIFYNLSLDATSLSVSVNRPTGFFTEEERPHVPSVFSVIRFIRDTFKQEDSSFGLFGAFGYDLVFQFEDLEQKKPRPKDLVDMELFLPLEIVVSDRKKEETTILSLDIQTENGWLSEIDEKSLKTCPVANSYPQPKEFKVTSDHTAEEFKAGVKKVVDGTKAGDYFEVVLSQTFSAPYEGTAVDVFRRISKINPSPYMFLVNYGEHQLVGASPEIFVRVTGDRFETCPIAGTVRRGATPIEDAKKAFELLSSKKEEAELTMCTDVDRNDMARVCVPGSVKVIGRRQLEFYSHLIHTVDHVEGKLSPEYDSIDAFQSHMWACTVTGAPKPAAMQEIEDLEKTPRGYYSSAVGFIGFDGNINTGITLRTALLKDGKANVRAGATLLFGSDPEAEEEETRIKAAGLLSALSSSEGKKLERTEDPLPLLDIKVALVDFRDSFVHNLAAYFRSFGCTVTTVRELSNDLLVDSDVVVLSPGPFVPSHFSMEKVIKSALDAKKPLLGVCLGHQGICEYFGGTLSVLPEPVHGKQSDACIVNGPLFEGVEKDFSVARYHSVYVEKESIPAELEVLSKTTDGDIVMAVQHRTLPVLSFQFHPESLMMPSGRRLLYNAVKELVK